MACAALSACDIPTSVPKAPIYDTEWNVPSKSDTISVATLLPSDSSIKVNAAKTAFLLSVNAVTASRVLGLDCGACQAITGTTAPKPAFSTTASATASLPGKLVTATLGAGDTLTLTLTNNYTFDPLKPPGGFATVAAGKCWNNQAFGFMVTTITSGGVVVGSDSINGATQALPGNGATLVRKVVLAGAVAQSTGLLVTSTICSPPGGNVAMDASKTFAAQGNVGNTFGVSSASILVNTQTVNPTSKPLDLSTIDSTITNHLKSGKLTLTITNPFAVAGALNLSITNAATAITPKAVAIAATATAFTDTVAFSGAELQAMFGNKVTLTFGGSVSQTGASVTVKPSDILVLAARLDVVVGVGCQAVGGNC